MGDFLGGVASGVGDVASQAVSQEALPVTLPLAGAAIGGLAGGGTGALEGLGAGALAGQLGGTGPLALFGGDNQSVLGSLFGFGGAGAGASGVSDATSNIAPGGAAVTTTPLPTLAPVGAAGGPATGGGAGAIGATFAPDVATAGAGTPQGFDATALSNFNAENTANPAAAAQLQNSLNATGLSSSASTGASGSKSFMDTIKPFIGPAVGAAGIGYEALKGTPQLPNQLQLTSAADTSTANAATAQAQAQPLINALSTGQLPAGAEASVDQAVKSNQAQIRSQFAGMGLAGSSMETEALNNATLQGQQQKFQIATNMAQTGISLANLANSDTALGAQIYQQLASAELSNDKDMQDAIVQFAQAIAGGGGGL